MLISLKELFKHSLKCLDSNNLQSDRLAMATVYTVMVSREIQYTNMLSIFNVCYREEVHMIIEYV